MVEAFVEFDYLAQEPDELTIKKGDVIREIIKKPGGWWEGTLRDKRGMFPDNFVSVIVKDKPAQRAKSTRSLRQCRAVFSYHPAHDDELSLAVGDVIDIVGEVEEGWWKGKLGDLEGVFPSNFVVELDAAKLYSKHSSKEDLSSISQENDGASPNLPPKPSKIICQVKYPYDACNEDELQLKEGDLITLINKDGQDRGWWKGELNGRIGVFPDNFVTVIPTPEVNGPPDLLNFSLKSEKSTEKVSPNRIAAQITSEISKYSNVALHRKSLGNKPENAPPLPGKKPNVPKKSPSTVSNSGVIEGLKKKIVDMVDGASSSKIKHEEKEKSAQENKDHDFDQVERSSMLPDVRANRPKAPGRRPPSTVYRDNELVNGNSDHSNLETKSETDEDDTEKKPKVKEWEKNKAPWVAELKQSQAKRSTVPDASRIRLTPDKSPEILDTDKKISHESSPVEMSKSLSSLNSTKLKASHGDMEVVMRNKTPTQPITITPARPQSIHSTSLDNKVSPITSLSPMNKSLGEGSPLSKPPLPESSSSHSFMNKPPIADKTNIDTKTTSPRSSIDKSKDMVPMKQYLELVDRVTQLETKMQQKFQEMQLKIEDLQGKLQFESEKRKFFEVELEKVAQCVTQV